MVTLGPALAEWQEKDMEHLRYEYPLRPEDIVLDLGSYRREFANEIHRRYGCYVECFDALDNRAAGTEDGEIEMGGQYYYTSAFEKSGNKSTYRCVNIAPFLNKEIALMKINIEGAEYRIMSYILFMHLAKNVKNFQVQFHIVDGMDYEKAYADIAESLSETHELTWRVPFVWENWRRKDG
jgi:hypothetical protein